jgi:hypothetical protein
MKAVGHGSDVLYSIPGRYGVLLFAARHDLHWFSHSIQFNGSCPEVKLAEAWGCLLTPLSCRGLECVEVYVHNPLYVFVALVWHSINLTFTLPYRALPYIFLKAISGYVRHCLFWSHRLKSRLVHWPFCHFFVFLILTRQRLLHLKFLFTHLSGLRIRPDQRSITSAVETASSNNVRIIWMPLIQIPGCCWRDVLQNKMIRETAGLRRSSQAKSRCICFVRPLHKVNEVIWIDSSCLPPVCLFHL